MFHCVEEFYEKVIPFFLRPAIIARLFQTGS
jgi:hypothetical protein